VVFNVDELRIGHVCLIVVIVWRDVFGGLFSAVLKHVVIGCQVLAVCVGLWLL
jgi:hypothetical protein